MRPAPRPGDVKSAAVPASASLTAPSGAQLVIRHGGQQAVVVEVGGGLREYTVDGHDRLDGYPISAVCSGGRGQVLMPWPNRVQDGRWEFAGRTQQLALTEPEAGNAIHGLVRWSAWQVVEQTESRVVVEHRLYPQPGWPGTLELRIEYELGSDGLAVTMAATNAGAESCPYGAGAHPYLTLGTPTVDSLTLELPARSYLEADERGIPIAVRTVTGTRFDYSEPRPIGTNRLDTGYTGLVRGADGRARVNLGTADGGRRMTLWVDESWPYLMVFTGDTLAASARRRGLAVEPMSCPPNALRSGDGLTGLEPGESHCGRWGIELG